MLTRIVAGHLKKRDDSETPIIEGYFSVFDTESEIYPNFFEKIDRRAFDSALDDDIRAIINHDTTFVLGRTKAGTLELETDDKGLFGVININPKDTAAMDLYHRVERGDVSQCSFGFDIVRSRETIDEKAPYAVHSTIEEVKLYEVSVVTFPAYEDTEISARNKDYCKKQIENIKKKAKLVFRKSRLKERIKKCL